MSASALDEVPADVIQLQLRVVDPKKQRKNLQQRENEAVQFDYNISTDNPNAVAQEMVCSEINASLQLLSHEHFEYCVKCMCVSTVLQRIR